ncbi:MULTISPECIES: anti-phage ZorAB system protein ZorA [unclassified Pseudoalteromonas]|uniref:anti-phage ZorAB system protein ZorA n=1 Tax=unclassified Pseudoalteromonas TaxID=194690 RepID=UPI000416660E|nr:MULTISPECIES: anti-phage ZorAB system protein ZorA [unclassified Pseudoalteromonas]MAD73883.1 chemotaxis protein [Rheinheimera sp.]MDN3402563.1 anti-phage ZorAB system protein ZorA [Pseudoalteromonas sp. APC 3213]MDN3432053.1 anti-phage ZorAB system protein ZorA [Pseudoalteromonas sp. APC 3907]MDN3466629.1 anti-phage ZorAB system protein ZorA [Pseudoalteromonas sp. APC 3495]TMS62604.1 chemotaxis protein [Pseudoalteromonas sp. S3173]
MFEDLLLNADLLWPDALLGRWFIIAMLLLFGFAIICVFKLSSNSKKTIKGVEEIVAGQTTSSLYDNIATIKDKAKASNNEVVKNLWREFDESLVLDHREKGVYNTLDAEHFFNPRTLASGITSNRLLAAAPSFLTAIGVLGTFLGLTMGLKGLHMETKEIEALKDGITSMINGSAMAFVTSVWGVGLSLLLNVFEKNTERRIVKKVVKVQQTIDFLFPRLPAEKSLVDISKNTSDSSEALQELHERIGNKLQETISGVSDSMQDAFTNALNNVMAPAMQSLVSNASQQTSGVLEHLISNFTESMQAAGRGQGELIQKSTEQMHEAVSSLSAQMSAVLEQSSNQAELMAQQQAGASSQFNQQLEAMLNKSEERQQLMEQKLFAAIESQQESQATREANHVDNLQSVLGGWLTEQSQTLNKLSDSMAEVQSAMGESNRGFVNELSSQNEKTTAQQQAFTSGLETSLQSFMQSTEQRQKVLEETFGSLINSQQLEASKRDSEYREQLQTQLGKWLAQQDQMLTSMTDAVKRTQTHMDSVIAQHKDVIGELKTVAESSATSSQNLSNSANQIGVLSGNLLKATELFDTRLADMTDTIKGISAQNDGLANHVIEQAKVLRGLETSLVATTEQFGSTAKLAQSGFSEMKTHQSEFIRGVEASFEGLSNTLAKQVSDIEKQTNEWLRSYSSEVNTQVKERMETWNTTTLEFGDQMRRTVSSISDLVDELERS